MLDHRGHGARHRLATVLSALGVAAVAIAGCGGSSGGGGGGGGSPQSKRHGEVGVPVIEAGSATGAVDTGKEPAGGKPVANVNWAINGDIVKFDPAFAYDYNSTPVVSQACEGLLRFDYLHGGRLIPNLATSWKQVNPTTYVYEIRQGVKFHDGSTMTPADVKFSYDRERSPKTGAYAGAYFASVKSVDVTGPHEITVRLSKPDATWRYAPAMTATGAIYSKKFVEAHGKDVGEPGVGMDCTGPFKFVSWTHGQQVVLKRFDQYWNRQRLPKVAQITFKVVPDEATLVAGLNSGELDGTTYAMDGRLAKGLSGPINLITSPSANIAGLMFNTQRKPWSDPRVRQAFAYALDTNAIRQSVFNGFGEAAKSPATPPMWTYSRSTFQRAWAALPNYSPQLAKAKQLIKEAGATGASGTLMLGTPTDRQVGLIVQQAAQQLGLKLSLQTVPFAKKTGIEYASGKKDYDLDLLTWLSDIPDPIGNLYFPYDPTGSITNISGFHNAVSDAALEAAKAAPTSQKEAQELVKAQSVLMRQVPWLPYIAQDSVVPLNKRLTGWVPSTFSYWNSWAADLSGT